MSERICILAVEDDREIGELVQQLLVREGFDAALAKSAVEMDAWLSSRTPGLILLDVMLPGEDGFSICRRLRATGNIPIVMLTAKGEDIDRIIGLELGADDYIAKPFNPRELIARIRAVLRRTAPAAGTTTKSNTRLAFDHFVFDLDARRLFEEGKEIELSTGDFDLLCAFTSAPQRVLSRDQLMDMTKGRAWEVYDRSIDVALSRLRRKIERDPAQPSLIITVRAAGYMFAAAVTKV